MEKLIKIQAELKVKKNLLNTFGKYNYRSAEGIYEALKPLIKKHNCTLTCSDKVVVLGDRYYVESTASLYNLENKTTIKTTAYARESLSRKGMDDAQITGSCSSYARKYALQGLFLLDESENDIDSKDNSVQEEKKENKENKKLKNLLNGAAKKFSHGEILELLKSNGFSSDPLKAPVDIQEKVEILITELMDS